MSDILVFGATGQVGRECASAGGEAVELLSRADADLAEPGAAARLIMAKRPKAIVNAAAYTAVDRAESEYEAALRLNAEAPEEMARAAATIGAAFVHLSTDYVFDGAASAPYAENSLTRPINVYGATKLDGERRVLAAHPRAVVLRTSWVFSAHGTNFVKTMLRLGVERDAINVVDDQIGGPTPAAAISGAALAIARALMRGSGNGGLYHYQGAPAASWADFAEAIFAAAGLAVAVNRITTANYPTPARRPLYSVLDCAKIARDFGLAQPDWREGLTQVVAGLRESMK